MASKRKLGESSSSRSSQVTTASLSALLSQLSLAAAEEDHEKAIKVASDVLSADPTNAHAAKQKAVALIKLDKYKEALAFLDEATFLNSAEVVLERGVCLYKLGRGKEAIEVLKGSSTRAAQHVLAQNVPQFTFEGGSDFRHTAWRILRLRSEYMKNWPRLRDLLNMKPRTLHPIFLLQGHRVHGLLA
jgi:tetratricopeptide (TPR) repeat protein